LRKHLLTKCKVVLGAKIDAQARKTGSRFASMGPLEHIMAVVPKLGEQDQKRYLREVLACNQGIWFTYAEVSRQKKHVMGARAKVTEAILRTMQTAPAPKRRKTTVRSESTAQPSTEQQINHAYLESPETAASSIKSVSPADPPPPKVLAAEGPPGSFALPHTQPSAAQHQPTTHGISRPQRGRKAAAQLNYPQQMPVANLESPKLATGSTRSALPPDASPMKSAPEAKLVRRTRSSNLQFLQQQLSTTESQPHQRTRSQLDPTAPTRQDPTCSTPLQSTQTFDPLYQPRQSPKPNPTKPPHSTQDTGSPKPLHPTQNSSPMTGPVLPKQTHSQISNPHLANVPVADITSTEGTNTRAHPKKERPP